MHIVTGFWFCMLAISLICTFGSDASDKEHNTYASVAAVSLLIMILIVGHWIAVLLGRL